MAKAIAPHLSPGPGGGTAHAAGTGEAGATDR